MPETVATFKTRLGQLLDDPDLVYYTAAEVIHSLNVGQRLFALITLCIERTASFPLTNATAWHQISDELDDYILPLRVSFSGVRLRPDTVNNLDVRDRSWRNRAGDPVRYVTVGADLLAVTPQPAAGSNTISLTYAAVPDVLAVDADIPEIPDDQSPTLQNFSVWWLRFKEGGQEHANTATAFKQFLDDAEKYASFVRARNRSQNYDRYPFDLASFDRSRFEVKLARMRTEMWMRKQEGDNGAKTMG